MPRILILGGTAEARELSNRLAIRGDVAVTLSLAGRTVAPAPHNVPLRIGGFGGAAGLAAYVREEGIDILIDATHPYAAMISANAAHAVSNLPTTLLALRRAPWTRVAGDRWTEVEGVAQAVQALGAAPRRVFLTLGRKEIAPFEAAPQHHYLVRSVDPIEPPLAVPYANYILGRGPFIEADDHALMARDNVDVVVAKNSGGSATYGKIAAARALGIDVILLRRPPLPAVPNVESVDDAVSWIDHALTSRMPRGV
ncbi:MAG TPA: cobalt-precorrin-6A reductase [Xanthobacteraceae bacterium]|jgi:precorrin-6A/cobalt-precorrin-6A reductase|nr:cobalt-precorrin-6A reductase [Xanthobacteraceae bacterium]